MIHLLASIVAIVFYLAAAVYQGRVLLKRDIDPPRRSIFTAAAVVAVAAHAISALGTIYTPHGIDLGFFRVSSLIFWFIALVGLVGSIRRPLQNTLVPVFALAALSIVVSILIQGPDVALPQLSPGVLAHILLSILAYAVLTVCAVQAVVLAVQEHALKQRQMSRLLNALPALQTMERMLFELLWIGMTLLSLAILAGALYVDDLFAQHLVHKTAFTIIAWCIFAVLLWGHHRLGWRGHTAVRWTLVGFGALMLAYFGTKLVLELILSGP